LKAKSDEVEFRGFFLFFSFFSFYFFGKEQSIQLESNHFNSGK